MAAPQQFSLRWNNYSQHIVTALDDLRADDELTDVTLSCEGQRLKAHKILLSACSSFFRDTFKENPCKHPIIIIKGVSFTDLEAVVTFMYNGQVNVSQDRLQTFLSAAELLQIKGLTDMNDKEEPAKKRPAHSAGNSSLNHNSSLSHSASRSGTPDSVQRPPSPKRKRAAVDNFSSNEPVSGSSGVFPVVSNNVGSPGASAGGGSNGTSSGGVSSGLNSSGVLPSPVGAGVSGLASSSQGDSDDPFHPNVSIKYEDEQEDDEYDDKANLSSEDNDNSMQDMMCNIEPGSIGSFLGGSGQAGLGTSGTDSSHGEDSSEDGLLLRPLDPNQFKLPPLLNFDEGSDIGCSSTITPTNNRLPPSSTIFPPRFLGPSTSTPSPTLPLSSSGGSKFRMIQPQPKSYGNISNLAIQSVFSITSGSGKDHSKTPPHLLPDLNPIMTTHGGVIIESIGGGGEMMGGNTTNTCEICGKQFTLRTNLTAHKKLHVRGATTCKWCSKTLSTIGNLRSHIQYVHANAPHPPRRHYTPRSGIHRKAYGSVSRQHRPPSGSSQDTDLDPLHFLDGIELNEGGGVIIPDSVAHQESTTSS